MEVPGREGRMRICVNRLRAETPICVKPPNSVPGQGVALLVMTTSTTVWSRFAANILELARSTVEYVDWLFVVCCRALVLLLHNGHLHRVERGAGHSPLGTMGGARIGQR